MITEKNIIEILNEYSSYSDESKTDKIVHEDNFKSISNAILSKLNQSNSVQVDNNTGDFKINENY